MADGRALRATLVLLVVLIMSIVVSLLMGRGGSWRVLNLLDSDPASAWLLLTQLRVPRVLLAVLVGATLGLSGAVLQGLLRNPLAEPGLLGASSGAAFGAVVVFYFSLGGALALPIGGMVGALTALTLVYAMAGRRADTVTVILAGVAVNALSAALTSLALSLAPNPYAVMEMVFWLLGSLVDRGNDQVLLVLLPMGLGWTLLVSCGRSIDALALGEQTAASLGFDPDGTRIRAALGTALAVGAAVSVSGAIGFIGLIVPHLVRPWYAHLPSKSLLPSALAGAALLTAADCVSRLPSGAQIHLGVITALLGAPFFVYLLLRRRASI